MNLWKKETVGTKLMYVDIFSQVQEPNAAAAELGRNYVESLIFGKDDQLSTELRMDGNEIFRLQHW